MAQRATPRAWHEGARRKPQGGYRFITSVQLTMAWWAFISHHIRLRDLHVYFACHEIAARRCGLKDGREPRYRVRELQTLVGGGEDSLRASLGRLRRFGLVQGTASALIFARSPEQLSVDELGDFWSMFESVPNRRRRVPVPRQLLKFLAGGARRGVVATALGHMLRGLFFRDGECTPNGAVKVSWIAETFRVGESTVKHARKLLVEELGLLEPLPTPQRTMNRHGCWFRWNLDWTRPAGVVDNSDGGAPRVSTESTPPAAESAPESTPPRENRELPSELQNPKPASGRPSGSCRKKDKAPSWKHIADEDLRDTPRLMRVFDHAVGEGVLAGSEADRLRFVSAAEHARSIGSTNPPGLFAWIVRAGRFEFCTQADEEAARVRLQRFDHGPPLPRKEQVEQQPRHQLSADAEVVRFLRSRLRAHGDPFEHLQKQRSDWTRERWNTAVEELERPQRDKPRGPVSLSELVTSFDFLSPRAPCGTDSPLRIPGIQGEMQACPGRSPTRGVERREQLAERL